MSEIIVTDNADGSRYEAWIGGALAGYAAYERGPGRIAFLHTSVEPAFEGHGVAGAIARHSLDLARAADESVVPTCPFYAGWIRKHPDYVDVVAPDHRSAVNA